MNTKHRKAETTAHGEWEKRLTASVGTEMSNPPNIIIRFAVYAMEFRCPKKKKNLTKIERKLKRESSSLHHNLFSLRELFFSAVFRVHSPSLLKRTFFRCFSSVWNCEVVDTGKDQTKINFQTKVAPEDVKSFCTRPTDFNRQFVTIKRLYIVTQRWSGLRFVPIAFFNISRIGQSDINTVNDDDPWFDFWTRSIVRSTRSLYLLQFALFFSSYYALLCLVLSLLRAMNNKIPVKLFFLFLLHHFSSIKQSRGCFRVFVSAHFSLLVY